MFFGTLVCFAVHVCMHSYMYLSVLVEQCINGDEFRKIDKATRWVHRGMCARRILSSVVVSFLMV